MMHDDRVFLWDRHRGICLRITPDGILWSGAQPEPELRAASWHDEELLQEALESFGLRPPGTAETGRIQGMPTVTDCLEALGQVRIGAS